MGCGFLNEMGCDFINEMECDIMNEGKSPASKFRAYGVKKDGLDVYLNININCVFFESDKFICPLCKKNLPEDEINKIKSLKRKDVKSFRPYFYIIEGTTTNYEEKIENFEKNVNEEEDYLQSLYYKHKCIKTNQEIYLYLYPNRGLFKKYLLKDREIYFGLEEFTSNICRRGPSKEDSNKITKNGYFRGTKLCGKVQVVDSFPDFKVQIVDSFPDLRVQKVESFPDVIGKWQFVDSFPDFKIQYVNSFPDFTIQFVDSFPGVN